MLSISRASFLSHHNSSTMKPISITREEWNKILQSKSIIESKIDKTYKDAKICWSNSCSIKVDCSNVGLNDLKDNKLNDLKDEKLIDEYKTDNSNGNKNESRVTESPMKPYSKQVDLDDGKKIKSMNLCGSSNVEAEAINLLKSYTNKSRLSGLDVNSSTSHNIGDDVNNSSTRDTVNSSTTVKDMLNSSTRDTVKSSTKDTVKSSTKDTVKSSTKDTVKSSAGKSLKTHTAYIDIVAHKNYRENYCANFNTLIDGLVKNLIGGKDITSIKDPRRTGINLFDNSSNNNVKNGKDKIEGVDIKDEYVEKSRLPNGMIDFNNFNWRKWRESNILKLIENDQVYKSATKYLTPRPRFNLNDGDRKYISSKLSVADSNQPSKLSLADFYQQSKLSVADSNQPSKLSLADFYQLPKINEDLKTIGSIPHLSGFRRHHKINTDRINTDRFDIGIATTGKVDTGIATTGKVDTGIATTDKVTIDNINIGITRISLYVDNRTKLSELNYQFTSSDSHVCEHGNVLYEQILQPSIFIDEKDENYSVYVPLCQNIISDKMPLSVNQFMSLGYTLYFNFSNFHSFYNDTDKENTDNKIVNDVGKNRNNFYDGENFIRFRVDFLSNTRDENYDSSNKFIIPNTFNEFKIYGGLNNIVPEPILLHSLIFHASDFSDCQLDDCDGVDLLINRLEAIKNHKKFTVKLNFTKHCLTDKTVPHFKKFHHLRFPILYEVINVRSIVSLVISYTESEIFESLKNKIIYRVRLCDYFDDDNNKVPDCIKDDKVSDSIKDDKVSDCIKDDKVSDCIKDDRDIKCLDCNTTIISLILNNSKSRCKNYNTLLMSNSSIDFY